MTQFLLLEVRKLREQLRISRMYERRLSQRCRVAEDERSLADRKAQEQRQDRLQLERFVSPDVFEIASNPPFACVKIPSN